MRNCLVIDLDRCSGCHSCEVHCKMQNKVDLGVYWNKVLLVGPTGTFPDIEQYALPMQCQQCKDAPCAKVCPTGATYRDKKTNVVLINKEKCLGCKYCMMACPYGVRSFNKAEKVVEKCTLCPQLTSAGEKPACVHNCCTGARSYGDLDDPTSDVSKVVAAAGSRNVHALPDVGNHPSTRYILHQETATWRES
jgi:Fe-S-cluster-containing dehydrogenase component